uniref:Uncharacterized protein n=1 Tax=Chlamydomonas euryale TaxID=1486919 RepID=A0A6U2HTG0_9CHLO|mmetsp:Transcript_39972/g.119024  ORF Transcript_39972/g.119024 Transcript_39972/m.119024 type:complete len:521 (+) Transcript_39972:233-1795(+)
MATDTCRQRTHTHGQNTCTHGDRPHATTPLSLHPDICPAGGFPSIPPPWKTTNIIISALPFPYLRLHHLLPLHQSPFGFPPFPRQSTYRWSRQPPFPTMCPPPIRMQVLATARARAQAMHMRTWEHAMVDARELSSAAGMAAVRMSRSAGGAQVQAQEAPVQQPKQQQQPDVVARGEGQGSLAACGASEEPGGLLPPSGTPLLCGASPPALLTRALGRGHVLVASARGCAAAARAPAAATTARGSAAAAPSECLAIERLPRRPPPSPATHQQQLQQRGRRSRYVPLWGHVSSRAVPSTATDTKAVATDASALAAGAKAAPPTGLPNAAPSSAAASDPPAASAGAASPCEASAQAASAGGAAAAAAALPSSGSIEAAAVAVPDVYKAASDATADAMFGMYGAAPWGEVAAADFCSPLSSHYMFGYGSSDSADSVIEMVGFLNPDSDIEFGGYLGAPAVEGPQAATRADGGAGQGLTEPGAPAHRNGLPEGRWLFDDYVGGIKPHQPPHGLLRSARRRPKSA